MRVNQSDLTIVYRVLGGIPCSGLLFAGLSPFEVRQYTFAKHQPRVFRCTRCRQRAPAGVASCYSQSVRPWNFCIWRHVQCVSTNEYRHVRSQLLEWRPSYACPVPVGPCSHSNRRLPCPHPRRPRLSRLQPSTPVRKSKSRLRMPSGWRSRTTWGSGQSD
jgi:hypothetical protein